ncbi:hypothetical protein GOBAR_AA24451 [Gossypium barbadense]|uniref:Cullin family profile domain-containing protein n=1 Tax=Gossypium barbadense TaxID=3634 RepID=A0A2P5WYQ6_GOSBA|nr:hypothetical protein GOBAR_AA24451 [Gossypium barbadense]
MDIDECYSQDKFSENSKLVRNIGKVVRDLRNLGFTSMTEDAYASAIFMLLKAKVHNLAGDDYRSSVLASIKGWIQSLTSTPVCNLGILTSLDNDSVQEILQSYDGFCTAANSLLKSSGDLSLEHDFVSHVHTLCKLGLHILSRDYFLRLLEEAFEKNGASRFWRHFEDYNKIEEELEKIDEDEIQRVLCNALEEICLEKENQEKCLLMLVHALQSYTDNLTDGKPDFDVGKVDLFSKYQLIVSSILMANLPRHFPVVPLQFLNALLAYLGDSISFDQHSSGIKSPLASQPSSCYSGTNTPSEGLIRWKLRLEYFAYETLQDLRIAKLFEIIVDYPESSPAIEDLKQCLEYTGQHSKLVESFISALRYRLLTAGASTNDILHQYVSTIKALRTIDPAGVFLEAVGEPIRDYLRGRKDTIKCIVTMLTDGSSGNPNGSGNSGDSLLEELNRDEENQENVAIDDDFNTDDKQAWIDAQRWEPDPVEADPLKGSRNRRKVDILGMIVGIIGSKDQLVNEYRVMLAEKLLNKSDYDIDSEIRTLELLKIHFGESSMQKCEIMLNDLIDSKRTNTNIKATISNTSQIGQCLSKEGTADIEYVGVQQTCSFLVAHAYGTDRNPFSFFEDEALIIPEPVDQLLSDYARRFHQIKTPRKLIWKKNLGTVKLELQFEDKVMQFTVAPVHAAIIMQFQDQTSWTSKNLAAATGIPVDVLNRRISFWISKPVAAETGISLDNLDATIISSNFWPPIQACVSLILFLFYGVLTESLGTDPSDHVFTLVDGMIEAGKNSGNTGNCEELLAGDEEAERSVASVEDQLRKEMTVYEYDSVKAGPSLESPYFRVLTRFMQVKLDVTWDSAQDWTCLYVDDTVWMVLQLPGFHG